MQVCGVLEGTTKSLVRRVPDTRLTLECQFSEWSTEYELVEMSLKLFMGVSRSWVSVVDGGQWSYTLRIDCILTTHQAYMLSTLYVLT